MVTIATFMDLSMAYLARCRLEAAGIRCSLRNEYLVGVQPLYANAVHGIELMVSPDDASLARSLLTEEVRPEDIVMEEEYDAPDLETALFEPEALCPECGGRETYRLRLSRLLLLFTCVSSLPARVPWMVYRCRSCGRIWREKTTEEITSSTDKEK